MQKKTQHFESQLEAYENSSENEVVNRLHQEIADFEQRIKARNLEIQILERRASSQSGTVLLDLWVYMFMLS